jgi:osmotically-inducible protein OsmY
MTKSFKAIGMAAGLALSVSVMAVVTAGCAGNQTSRSTGTYIDDTAVSTKVKTELLTDKDVKGTEVKVRTYNGEVQLSGFVDSPDQKIRAVQVARAVPGVRVVWDDLIVKAPATAQGPAVVQEAAGAEAPVPPPVPEPNANR